MVRCLTWMWQLWSRLSSLCSIQGNRDYISNLTNDILIDIFSRLPADSVLACGLVCTRWCYITSSQHFAEPNLRGATPVTLALLDYRGKWGCDIERMPDMFCLEDVGKTTRFEKVLMEDDSMLWKEKVFQPLLIASCNGLLLFKYFRDTPAYVICNPMTQEAITLSGNGYCGFFFDQFTKEYKFLRCHVKGNLSTFFLYGSRTKELRKLSTSKFRPWLSRQCIMLPTALFWMAAANHRIELYELMSPCSECIMMFNMDNEEFSVLPHPGNTCSSTDMSEHRNMRLLSMDAKLVFSDLRMSERLVNIWVLEDLVNYSWVKRYIVNLEEVLEEVLDRFSFSSRWYGHWFLEYVEVWNILNGELLLNWRKQGLCWYNLQSKRVRKIRTGSHVTRDVKWYPSETVTYTKSLVSLKDYF